nr:unnamed protein product [Digitaria exilis]
MATATEEPRLLGPALAAEDAGEIDGAVGEQGPPRGDDDDEEILRFMDSVDGYLLLMDSLSSTLRQGWLDLASARHSMGATRVSSTLLDHKEQSAATKLQVLDHAGLQISESNPHFALSKWSLQEECHSTCNAASYQEDGNHERDATKAGSSTGSDTSSQVQRARSKALSVFGALVSPKLRTAQISFETALELIVELANSRSNMLASFSQLKE